VDSGRAPVVVALAALLAACVAAFAIGTPARSLRGDAAARALLDTWRQSRSATFVVDSDFSRTLPDGQQLKDSTRIVQRPPNDRLTFGFGSIAGRRAGRIYRCAAETDRAPNCLTSTAAPDYASEVDGEVAALAGYVQGPRPLYRVISFADSPGACYRLELAVELPAPPYGRQALFCFDRTTLAPTLTVIVRTEATDRTQARTVTGQVTDADLQVPG
jgi:hypothetical protein